MRAAVYVSKSLVEFDEAALDALARDSARHNAEYGVTGYLYFERDRFIQYVEGPESAIDDLIRNIKADPRHEVLVDVSQAIEQRRFAEWDMQRFSKSDVREVRIEHILTEHMLFMHDCPTDEEHWADLAWGLVDHLRSLQTLLKEIAEG